MTKKNKPTVALLGFGEMAPFAFRSLSKLFAICAVITPPLKSNSFHMRQASAVENLAKDSNVPIIRTNDNLIIRQKIISLKPNALVICSYNKILPPAILALLPCINVHHGDLPRWRGRANLNWAIITGRKNVSLTIHEAVPTLDAGNIYRQYNIPITNKETIASLYEKVNTLVEENLGKITLKVLTGYHGTPQQGTPTYCCTRLPEDGYINWNNSTVEIDRFIRALTNPFPGAFTYYQGFKLIIWSAEIPKKPRIYEGRIPGRIILIHKNHGVEILTGTSSIIIKEVEFQNQKLNASQVIKTINASLGINWIEVIEKIYRNEN